MELFWWGFGVVWLAGWIKELSYVHKGMERHGIDYPDNKAKYVMPVLLFVAWPYFHFYRNS